jgi:predicted methyltransferase
LAETDTIVREVAHAVGLAEGVVGVRAVVDALVRLEPVSTRRLSRAAGLPVPIVASICGELRKRDVVAVERPAQLTVSGRALFGAERLVVPSCACPHCAGRGLIVAPGLAPSVRDIARFARRAPAPRFELDQCHCTVETKLRRVLALHEADALVGRRVLLLGDDDLVSLAIASVVARFGSGPTLEQLTVVDVDPRVIAFARRELARAPFAVTCVEHDLRNPLPGELAGSFDTVLTDPPYTAAGARLFVSRAAEALRGAGTVFFSFGSRRAETTFAVQRDIVRMGFAIQALVPAFNRYVGAGVLAGTSDLYRLVASHMPTPLVAATFADPLYTTEVSGRRDSARVSRAVPRGRRRSRGARA